MDPREISRELVVWDDATELPPWDRLVVAPQVDPPVMPSFFRRAWNFSRALTLHIIQGTPITPEQIRAHRMAVCKSNECGFYKDEICRHGSCGCVVSRKVAWMGQSCPVGKW